MGKGRTIVLVFTDGRSDDYAKTLKAAKQLKKKATVFTIGIGSIRTLYHGVKKNFLFFKTLKLSEFILPKVAILK